MKRISKLILAFLILNFSFSIHTHAQVAINEDNTDPEASAMLDVKSTDKGILIPRMTTAEREDITNPANGLMVFDKTTNTFWYYTTAWQEIKNTDVQSLAVRQDSILIDNGSGVDVSSLRQVGENGLQYLDTLFNTLVDVEQEDIDGVTSTTTSIWQSFTPTVSAAFVRLDLHAPNNNSLFSEGNLQIYEGEGTGGTLLYQTTITSINANWNTFDLSAGAIHLTAGTRYTFAIQSTGQVGGTVGPIGTFILSTYGLLEDGYTEGSSDLGGDKDYVFRTYYESSTSFTQSLIEVNPTATDSVMINLHKVDTVFFVDGSYQITASTDNQTIDKLHLNDTILELSLENDGEEDQTIDLISFKDNTDDQTIDSLSVEGGILTVSLENDGVAPYQVDLSRLTDISAEESFNAGFLGFSNSRSLNVDYKEQGGGFFVVTNSSDPSWQSFTAMENGLVDVAQVTLGSSPSSSYTYTLYEGEGIDGTALGTASISNPAGNVWVDIDFSSDSIILQKGRIYTLGFDSRSRHAYENNNPYPDGRAGNSSNWDYVIRVYTFPPEYAFSVENGQVKGTEISSLQSEVTALQNDLQQAAPVGTIQMWPTSTPPTGWLICNGSSFSSATYPDLANVLGSTNLPNFSGRFPLGVGNSGTSGSTNHNIGSNGGEEKHTLSINEMPNHSHGAGSLSTSQPYLSQVGSGNQDKRDGGGTKLYEYTSITGNTASVGGGQAHNNMPPFYVIHFIIRAE